MTNFKLIRSTQKYKTIIEFLDHGRVSTPESIVFEKDKIQFEAKFIFAFYYDTSNGIVSEIPESPRVIITKSDGNTVTEIEKKWIETFIKSSYR